ncbi:hypothetical protein Tco_0926785 [Tanacetum coccineum]|uniref:Reverse transcriptase domain-containing protein n=1 Tax=Tanacetum coccineum TaxID=301880 RepID=A0ABQ5DAX6_9ASTR
MPFGLRNAGATYQRLVDKTFHGLDRRKPPGICDDLVIKSRTEDEVVRDIEETFKTLRKHQHELNQKSVLWSCGRRFLGYQVNIMALDLPRLGKKTRGTHLGSYLAASNEAAKKILPSSPYHLVITDNPSNTLLSKKPEKVTGRMAKSGAYNYGSLVIHFRQSILLKGQVFSRFIVGKDLEEEGQNDFAKEEEPLPTRWILLTDGSSCVDECGAGVILTDSEGV